MLLQGEKERERETETETERQRQRQREKKRKKKKGKGRKFTGKSNGIRWFNCKDVWRYSQLTATLRAWVHPVSPNNHSALLLNSREKKQS